jgi:hypothetical protein
VRQGSGGKFSYMVGWLAEYMEYAAQFIGLLRTSYHQPKNWWFVLSIINYFPLSL